MSTNVAVVISHPPVDPDSYELVPTEENAMDSNRKQEQNGNAFKTRPRHAKSPYFQSQPRRQSQRLANATRHITRMDNEPEPEPEPYTVDLTQNENGNTPNGTDDNTPPTGNENGTMPEENHPNGVTPPNTARGTDVSEEDILLESIDPQARNDLMRLIASHPFMSDGGMPVVKSARRRFIRDLQNKTEAAGLGPDVFDSLVKYVRRTYLEFYGNGAELAPMEGSEFGDEVDDEGDMAKLARRERRRKRESVRLNGNGVESSAALDGLEAGNEAEQGPDGTSSNGGRKRKRDSTEKPNVTTRSRKRIRSSMADGRQSGGLTTDSTHADMDPDGCGNGVPDATAADNRPDNDEPVVYESDFADYGRNGGVTSDDHERPATVPAVLVPRLDSDAANTPELTSDDDVHPEATQMEEAQEDNQQVDGAPAEHDPVESTLADGIHEEDTQMDSIQAEDAQREDGHTDSAQTEDTQEAQQADAARDEHSQAHADEADDVQGENTQMDSAQVEDIPTDYGYAENPQLDEAQAEDTPAKHILVENRRTDDADAADPHASDDLPQNGQPDDIQPDHPPAVIQVEDSQAKDVRVNDTPADDTRATETQPDCTQTEEIRVEDTQVEDTATENAHDEVVQWKDEQAEDVRPNSAEKTPADRSTAENILVEAQVEDIQPRRMDSDSQEQPSNWDNRGGSNYEPLESQQSPSQHTEEPSSSAPDPKHPNTPNQKPRMSSNLTDQERSARKDRNYRKRRYRRQRKARRKRELAELSSPQFQVQNRTRQTNWSIKQPAEENAHHTDGCYTVESGSDTLDRGF